MCLNPTYVLHPNINRIYQHHHFDSVCLDGYVSTSFSLRQLKSYPYTHEMSDDSEYVRSHYYLFDSDSGESYPLFFSCPCGKCADCARSRYGELAARLQFEVLSYPSACRIIFFTLTYRDACLPSDGVSKSDVTDFINKFHIYAKRNGLGDGFRTFIVSEYGTDPRFTHRPHYHGLIFGLDLSEFGKIKTFTNVFLKSWNGKGRVDWQFARSNHGVSKYCVKYVIKGMNHEFVPEGKNKNFISYPRKSGGLGVNALKVPEILDKIINSSDGSISVKTIENTEHGQCAGISRIRIPRFIIDKLYPNFSRFIPSNIKVCCQWASVLWNILCFRGYNVNLLPYEHLENFATYLRGFVFHQIPKRESPYIFVETSSRYTKFLSGFSSSQLVEMYNLILAYLGAYKYSIDDALESVGKRELFMRQINPCPTHISPHDRLGDLSSFLSNCYVTSELDAVFEL